MPADLHEDMTFGADSSNSYSRSPPAAGGGLKCRLASFDGEERVTADEEEGRGNPRANYQSPAPNKSTDASLTGPAGVGEFQWHCQLVTESFFHCFVSGECFISHLSTDPPPVTGWVLSLLLFRLLPGVFGFGCTVVRWRVGIAGLITNQPIGFLFNIYAILYIIFNINIGLLFVSGKASCKDFGEIADSVFADIAAIMDTQKTADIADNIELGEKVSNVLAVKEAILKYGSQQTVSV